MNKDEFLKKLEKKLNILSIEEREDTINEYRNIIDEKIAHGKSEEEAVKEAGNIDELAKEILEAYKINPDYKRNDKTFAEGAEEAIKKGAKKLSEMTEEVVDNIKNTEFEFTTQNVFEIVLKVIIVLFTLALLKIPFSFIERLVVSIFDDGALGMFGTLTTTMFLVLIEFAYIVICILIIVTLINKYTKKVTNIKKDQQIDNEKQVNDEEKVIRKEKRIKTNFSDVILFVIKIFLVTCFIIPLSCITVGLSIILAFIIYLMFKGIYAYGILVLTIGALIFSCSFISLIFDLMNKTKIKYYPFVVGFIVTLVGGFMTLDYISGFTYIDRLDESRYNITTKTFTETITKDTDIYYLDELKIDDTLEDNQIIIDVTYSSEYLGIDLERREKNDVTQLMIHGDRIKAISWNEDILEDIKNQSIYDYRLLGEARVVVRVNAATSKYVK